MSTQPTAVVRVLQATAVSLLFSFVFTTALPAQEGEGPNGVGRVRLTLADGSNEVRYRFDLGDQSLSQALRDYGQISGQEIIFTEDLVAGRLAPTVKGNLTAAAALEQLLNGSGLTAERSPSGALMIKRINSLAQDSNSAPGLRFSNASESDKPSSGTGAGKSEKLRLAQAQGEENRTVEGERTNPSAPVKEQKKDVLTEVLVTGTHIRGVGDVAAPTLTITREDIEHGNYPSIEKVFRDLPQNFGEITESGVFNSGASRLGSSNADRAAGIDLRGIGTQSTLVLLNGMRRAPSNGGLYVDVSTIPLSVIERVEVITAGRSAIYGADAVAGVANLITRRSFEGIETQLFYDWAEDGGENFQGSLTTGAQLDRGGIIVAYDFASTWPLDLVPIHQSAPQFVTGSDWVSRDYVSDTDRHSGFLAGQWTLTDNIELYIDALYTSKDSEFNEVQHYPGATSLSTRVDRISSDIYNVSAGSHIGLAHSWKLTASAGLSQAKIDNGGLQLDDFGFATQRFEFQGNDEAELSTLSAIVDGPLPAIGSITPSAALGLEYREEVIRRVSDSALDGFPVAASNYRLSRDVQSLFGELHVPLVASGPAGLRRLELSLAGRYDDYDDFGSSFNPQAGVVWELVEGLELRAAYSSAFRAPALDERRPQGNSAFIMDVSDPVNGGTSPVMFFGGASNSQLRPEEADVWSLDLEYRPSWAPKARFSTSYFNIEYVDRLDFPISSPAGFPLALVEEPLYPGLIDRDPSEAEIADLVAQISDGVIFNFTPTPWDPATQTVLEAFPGLVTFESRLNNIAVDRVSGIDFAIDADFETSFGTLSTGLSLTRTLEHERKITATSPAFEILNEVGKPVDFRARLTAGWNRGAYGAFAAINYTDSYVNRLTVPTSPVASWTTADLTFQVDGSLLPVSNFMQGLRVIGGITNVFDREPPEIVTTNYLFDAANANPLGRQLSLRIVKKW